jgi:ribosomal protein S12 methylthiotransferase accessory factor
MLQSVVQEADKGIATRALMIGEREHEQWKGAHGARLLSARAMLERVRPLLDCCGVTRLANITGLDRVGVPVALAIRPNGETLSTSAGKGLTLEQALVSAAMEAIETTVAETLVPDKRGLSWKQMESSQGVIDAARVSLRRFAGLNRDWQRDWLMGWDLLQECNCAVPFSMVSLTRPSAAMEPPIFPVSSNGLASGATLLEAGLSAVLEVIERDAMGRSGIFGSGVTRVDLSGADVLDVPVASAAVGEEPVALGELLERSGLRVFAVQIQSIPPTYVYAVVVVDGNLTNMGVYHGSACALDSGSALRGALLEALQSRAVYIAGTRDDYSSETHQLLRRSHYGRLFQRSLEQLSEQRYVPGSNSTESLHGDIELLGDGLRSRGLEQLIVLDLSRATLPGIHVAKVVAPGLAEVSAA